jgi:hypothetical protein
MKRASGAFLSLLVVAATGLSFAGLAAYAKSPTVTVAGTTQRAVIAAISRACDGHAAGTVLFPNGTYTVNGAAVHLPGHCTLRALNQGMAILKVSRSDYAIYVDGNSITITGLVFDGGGILINNRSPDTPTSDVTITLNTFENIGGGNNGIASGGSIWARFNITYNHFRDISYNAWPAVAKLGDVPNPGTGINQLSGIDQSIINHNTFDHIQGDGIHIAFNAIIGNGDAYTTAANNDISYNTFTFIHRMGLEYQGTTDYDHVCAAGCTPSRISGATVKGNFYYLQYFPYYASMGFSLVIDQSLNARFYNNTAVNDQLDACYGAPYAMENSGDGQISQGNVLSAVNACQGSKTPGWSSYFATASIGSGYTVVHQNNLLCGPLRRSVGNGAGQYFGYEGYNNQAKPGQGLGNSIEKYNYVSATCPNPTNPAISTLAIAFASADNQALPSHGRGTWNLFATDEISIVNVQFFIDELGTPVVTQEVQDLNTNFAADRKWLYHATIDMSRLSEGAHTILAVATDVSGAVQTVKQSFEVYRRSSGLGSAKDAIGE